jgi:ribose transport system ATP-binding protein
MLLPSYRLLGRLGLRRVGSERSVFGQAAGALRLHPQRGDLEARRFSGGNQQKLVIARWLNALGHCRLLLLDEPTQGVDVGARKEIYDALRAAAADGRSVVVTSSEPDELMQIADRVVVLSGGRIAGVLEGGNIAEARMLSLAHSMEHEEIAAA